MVYHRERLGRIIQKDSHWAAGVNVGFKNPPNLNYGERTVPCHKPKSVVRGKTRVHRQNNRTLQIQPPNKKTGKTEALPVF